MQKKKIIILTFSLSIICFIVSIYLINNNQKETNIKEGKKAIIINEKMAIDKIEFIYGKVEQYIKYEVNKESDYYIIKLKKNSEILSEYRVNIYTGEVLSYAGFSSKVEFK